MKEFLSIYGFLMSVSFLWVLYKSFTEMKTKKIINNICFSSFASLLLAIGVYLIVMVINVVVNL